MQSQQYEWNLYCKINFGGRGSQLSSRRININGGFQVFQDQPQLTSVGASGEGYFALPILDKVRNWKYEIHCLQSTDVPAGYGFQTVLKYDCTTAVEL